MSSNDPRVDFFEVGDKTALLCVDPVTTEAVQTTLKNLGFKIHSAETADVAIERLRYTQYDCLVLQESFAGSSLRSNAVLNYLMPLTMTLRRYSFVCLIGNSFKTLDAMQAFAYSVHLVVNPVDLPNLTAILKKGLTEFELLYRIYKETLAKE
jgi:hypothetical protein